MAIKTILFDLGGVLLTNDWHHEFMDEMNAEYKKKFNIDADALSKQWDIYWPLYKIAKIDEKKFWKNLFKDAENYDVKEVVRIWKKYQKVINPELFDLIKKLKKNYKVVALSNVSKEAFEYKRKRFRLDDYFEGYFTTYAMGLAKPYREIYEKTLEQLKNRPEECLFIDNSLHNLDVPKKMGLHCIHFVSVEKLEKDLKKLVKL